MQMASAYFHILVCTNFIRKVPFSDRTSAARAVEVVAVTVAFSIVRFRFRRRLQKHISKCMPWAATMLPDAITGWCWLLLCFPNHQVFARKPATTLDNVNVLPS